MPSAHDVWGIYKGDQWLMRWAEGCQVSGGVTLIQTPGHADADITTLAATEQGLVAFPHLWWTDTRPSRASDVDTAPETFATNRARVLDLNPSLILPAHGPSFIPTAETPAEVIGRAPGA